MIPGRDVVTVSFGAFTVTVPADSEAGRAIAEVTLEVISGRLCRECGYSSAEHPLIDCQEWR